MGKLMSYGVLATGFLEDGCQLVLYDHPQIAGRYPGMIVEPLEMTVTPGMTVTLDMREDGQPFDGKSTVRYRFGSGPWLNLTTTTQAHAASHNHVITRAMIHRLLDS